MGTSGAVMEDKRWGRVGLFSMNAWKSNNKYDIKASDEEIPGIIINKGLIIIIDPGTK